MQDRDEVRLQGAWRVAEVLGLDGEDAEDAARSGYWFVGDRLITGDEEAAWEWLYRLEGEEGGIRRLVTWSPDSEFSGSFKAILAFEDAEILFCYSIDERDSYPERLSPGENQVVLRLVRSTLPVPE